MVHAWLQGGSVKCLLPGGGRAFRAGSDSKPGHPSVKRAPSTMTWGFGEAPSDRVHSCHVLTLLSCVCLSTGFWRAPGAHSRHVGDSCSVAERVAPCETLRLTSAAHGRRALASRSLSPGSRLGCGSVVRCWSELKKEHSPTRNQLTGKSRRTTKLRELKKLKYEITQNPHYRSTARCRVRHEA